MHPGWQRICYCLFKKNILTKQKKNDLNSSSFWAGSVRSHVCSSPAYLAQGPTASHGIGLPLLCLDRQVSLGPFSPAVSKGTPSSHTLFNSWKTFMDNWGSADHGLQATDLDCFSPGLQTKISCLDHSWQHVVPEGIRVLMLTGIQSYLLCRFKMLMWTFLAN